MAIGVFELELAAEGKLKAAEGVEIDSSITSFGEVFWPVQVQRHPYQGLCDIVEALKASN